jgi:DNA-binding beta-propeller fold protein YncE
LAGGYAYIANQGNGTISVCTINPDGSLSGCALSSVGSAPTDVVINGSQAYVDDASGNVYLCAVGAAGALTNCVVSNGGASFNLGIQIAIH